MPIHYAYDADTRILTATADGDITPEENAESNARVRREMDRHPGLKLLVDMRGARIAASPTAMIQMMEAFYALVGDALPVAIVNSADPDRTHAMLAETNAYIAGAQMRLYDNLQQATDWLDRL